MESLFGTPALFGMTLLAAAGAVVAVIGVLLAFGLMLIMQAIRIVKEYERGVIFRLGRLVGAKGPGLFFIVPFIDSMVKVDLRVVTLDVPSQEAITRDNVTVKVNAVVYFRVLDPSAAIVNVENYKRATWLVSQTTLRSVLGQSELDELLANRDKINAELCRIIDEETEPWGIKVSMVEVKDVELPPSMQRAMAKQAEAEREKRAKIIHAEGENTAAHQLADAAQTLATQPAAIQLRYLQTLTEIGVEQNSTIIFPVPVDLIAGFMQKMGIDGPSAEGTGGPRAAHRSIEEGGQGLDNLPPPDERIA